MYIYGSEANTLPFPGVHRSQMFHYPRSAHTYSFAHTRTYLNIRRWYQTNWSPRNSPPSPMNLSQYMVLIGARRGHFSEVSADSEIIFAKEENVVLVPVCDGLFGNVGRRTGVGRCSSRKYSSATDSSAANHGSSEKNSIWRLRLAYKKKIELISRFFFVWLYLHVHFFFSQF